MLKNIKKIFIANSKTKLIEEVDIDLLNEMDNILSFDVKLKQFVESKIIKTSMYFNDEAVVIDGKFYSLNNLMFVKKNNLEEFVAVDKLDTTYQKYLVHDNIFVNINTIEKIEAPISIKSIVSDSHNNYICGIVILRDKDGV